MTSFGQFALLVVLLVPMAVDTFVVSAALGLAGLPRAVRLRTSVILACFEAAMPIVGVLVGRGAGAFVGHVGGYAAAAVIGLVGAVLLRSGGVEEREHERLRLLARARGPAVLYLGIAVSADELAIGLGLGLLHLSLPAAVAFIGVQAFAASQAGLLIGARIGEDVGERAERLAGALLIGVAAVLLVVRLTGHEA